MIVSTGQTYYLIELTTMGTTMGTTKRFIDTSTSSSNTRKHMRGEDGKFIRAVR